jgi:transcriptional regulator with XRE-family HTH domain
MNLQLSVSQFTLHLKGIRENKQLSQLQLARYSGLEVNHIVEIESGYALPELETLVLLSTALDVEVKDLDY